MNKKYDVIIIGSGFGGSMVAKKMIDAGLNIAIIERGEWIRRGPHNWDQKASIDLSPYYDKSVPYHVIKGGNKPQMGSYSAVGGPSLFYGGVSFRFREEDFHPPTDIIGDSHAEWPIQYDDLEKYYGEAESILNISGEAGVDPTEPYRSTAYPQGVPPYANITKKIKSSAEQLGLRPFRLPLAINYSDQTRNLCQFCTTCDTFACAVSAKNDLDSMLLQGWKNQQIDIYADTIVHQLEEKNGRIERVHCINKKTDEKLILEATTVVLSAGALGSPHLILNSELDKLNSAGEVIGRYLMRHINAIVFGFFTSVPDKQKRFHKEIAILDYYLGHDSIDYPKEKIGSLQQVPTPPSGLVESEAPKPLGKVAGTLSNHVTGLLAIGEDQPQYKNYITIDKNKKEKYGMYRPIVSHEYSQRDEAAIKVLIKEAKKIMSKSGALFNYVHHIKTFSHVVGTIRMGNDPKTAPLDKNCQFRGLSNLFVVDGSFMPTSAALNPSLTISANALKVSQVIAEKTKKMKSHEV